MSSPFVGEIRMFAGNFAPQGWDLCQGQLLSIAEFSVLFQLLGTTYGGDGTRTFGLPDLRGRIPVHQGTNPNNRISYVAGQKGGEEQVTLTVNQIPQHTHVAQAQTANGSQQGPQAGVWASSSLDQFSSTSPNGTMNPAAVSAAGSSQAHTNIMPYLAVNFIIALFGTFPSQD
jgi:microcystin-dependent protein